MVGSASTLMKVRLIRSKLRKREESSSASPTDIEAQQQQQQQHYALRTRVSFADSNSHHIAALNGHRQGSKSSLANKTNKSGLTIEAVAASNKSVNSCHSSLSGYCSNDSNSTSEEHSNNDNCKKDKGECEETVTFARTSGIGGVTSNGWVFPPKAPTPNIYHCMTQVSPCKILLNDFYS